VSVLDLNQFKSRRVRKPGASHAWSPSAERWVEVEQLPNQETAREGRKPFQAQWVRFPLSWLVALRQTKSGSAWRLAAEILFAEFRRQHTRGEIVLSAATTGLPHSTRPRAVQQLVRLGLIEVEQSGRQAVRVTKVHLNPGEAH
jgi:hypothetical protein